MALPPLATSDDLAVMGIDVSNSDRVNEMLAVASAEVRRAAGCAISRTTSTVRLSGRYSDPYIVLPGVPIESVTAVEVDGVAITDFYLDDNRLHRKTKLWADCYPTQVDVTYVHGMLEVPADVRDLVRSLAAAGLNAALNGYAARTGVVSERIDDYSVTYAQGADAVERVMELPRRTRTYLRSRFGASVGTVRYR